MSYTSGQIFIFNVQFCNHRWIEKEIFHPQHFRQHFWFDLKSNRLSFRPLHNVIYWEYWKDVGRWIVETGKEVSMTQIFSFSYDLSNIQSLDSLILFYFVWIFSLSTEHQLHAYGCVWISFWNDDEKLFHVHSERRRKKEGWGSEKNGKIFVEVQRKFLFCSFLSFDKLTYSINIDGVSRCPLYG